jgi:hypothetical protein
MRIHIGTGELDPGSAFVDHARDDREGRMVERRRLRQAPKVVEHNLRRQ